VWRRGRDSSNSFYVFSYSLQFRGKWYQRYQQTAICQMTAPNAGCYGPSAELRERLRRSPLLTLDEKYIVPIIPLEQRRQSLEPLPMRNPLWN
jgi:hypothetical protein